MFLGDVVSVVVDVNDDSLWEYVGASEATSRNAVFL